MSLEAHTLVVTRSRHNYKVEAAGGHCTELHQAQPPTLPSQMLHWPLNCTLHCTVHCTVENIQRAGVSWGLGHC